MNKDLQGNHSYSSTLLIILSIVVVFGQQIWVPGFFHDGYLYAALGRNALEQGDWWLSSLSEANYPVYNQHPPLTFILEGIYFKLFGISWVTARLFNVLITIGMVSLLMTFLKRRGKKNLGLLSGTILVLTPPLLKNARFPNTDILLTFFILAGVLSFSEVVRAPARISKIILAWFLTGLCFGLALLTKGPPAMVLPFTIGLYILLTNKWKILKSPWPWIFFMMGILIFSLWPFILWQKGVYHHFLGYVSTQFTGTIVTGRARKDLNVFEYLIYFFKHVPPWIILGSWGLVQIIRDRKNSDKNLEVLMASLFLSVLIPFSLLRWKYSHYLLPCYPALATLAAYPLQNLSTKFHHYFSKIFQTVIVATALVLLVFPLTTSIKRDKEIFVVLDMIKYLPQRPTMWLLSGDVYPYYSLVNLMSWMKMGNVRMSGLEPVVRFLKGEQTIDGHYGDWEKRDKKWIVLLRKKEAESLEENFSQEFAQKFTKLIYFAHQDLMVLVSSELMNQSIKGKSFFQVENKKAFSPAL